MPTQKKSNVTKICGNAELFLIKEMTAVYLLEKLRVANNHLTGE
jgi:hypothetical protein